MAEHDTHERPRAFAALFQSRAEARSAIAALHKAKYTHTWMGSTSLADTAAGGTAVTVESGGFFSGPKSLTDALVSQGVNGDDARELEEHVEPGNTLDTVDPKDRDILEALDIVADHGGRTTDDAADWGVWPPSNGMYGDANGTLYEEELFIRR